MKTAIVFPAWRSFQMAFDQYLDSVAVAGQVTGITGKLEDGVIAAAYASWIQSVSGDLPKVLTLPDNRAKITWQSETQIKTMQTWLDQQVKAGFTPTAIPASVEYDLGTVLKPWALRYALPAGILLFLAGWLAHMLIGKVVRL